VNAIPSDDEWDRDLLQLANTGKDSNDYNKGILADEKEKIK